MRAGRAEPQVLGGGEREAVRAQPAELALGVRDARADRRMQLDQRLEQLLRHQLGERAAFLQRQDALDPLDEVQRLPIEEHELLLDADRQRRTGTEAMIEDVDRCAQARHDPRLGRCALRAIGSLPPLEGGHPASRAVRPMPWSSPGLTANHARLSAAKYRCRGGRQLRPS